MPKDKPKPKLEKMFTVRLTAEEEEMLQTLAEMEGRTASNYIRRQIKERYSKVKPSASPSFN